MSYEFKCNNKKQNPDFPCNIHLEETVYQKTEVIPKKVEDSFELEYGYSDYLDSEVKCYYCNNCDTEFTYEQVLVLIVEEEE
jgi:hypothetical protein|tara:strand:+ start:476 stop:721 length:246 start_codon:yes stop_codon:yes gene_type:complete